MVLGGANLIQTFFSQFCFTVKNAHMVAACHRRVTIHVYIQLQR